MLILHLSIVLLLIIMNSVFAMAEIALVSARKARLVPLAEAGNRGAQAALELKADPSRLLSTVQIGVTLIAVLSGTFGEATLGDQLERQLGTYPGFTARYAHVISMAVVVHRHLVFLADSRRARPKAPRTAPPRADRRCARPVHARGCPGGSTDRMVLERIDRFRASPAAGPQPGSRPRHRRGDHLHAARGSCDRTHTRTPRRRSSKWRCASATDGRAPS